MKILTLGLAATLLVAASAATQAQQTAPASPPAAAPGAPAAAARPPAAPPARAPELALAIEAAQTAIATCAANGYKVGVSIVDSAGTLKVLLAADGAAKMAVQTSTTKAYTANALKASTTEIAANAATDPALAAKIAADPNMFARAGALPIMVGADVIGAIGVGGSPGGDKDEACALAGLNQVKDRLK